MTTQGNSPRINRGVRLTDRFIDTACATSLASRVARVEYRDTEQQGLLVRVANGKATFYLFRRVPGHPTPRRIMLGKVPTMNVNAARRAAARKAAELRADPTAVRRANVPNVLFAMTEFVEDVRAFLVEAERGLEPDPVRLRRALERIGADLA